MLVKAVLFDLDGTLLDRDSSLLSFVRDQYDQWPEFQAIKKEIFVQRFMALDKHGYVWNDKVYQQMIDEFSIPNMDWADLLNDYISHFKRHCIAYPNLLSVLTQLKRHGIKLALVSNGFGQFQYENFKALHVEHLFDEVLISEWEGLRKPDPAIFKRALDKLGVPPEHALFVGDHPDNDIRASRKVGMKAVWKRNGLFETVAEANAEIDDLEELIPIVSPPLRGDRVRPDILENIKNEAKEIGFSMSCDELTGSLLSTLAAIKTGGSFLEIGTGAGVSTYHILSGMSPASTLVSIDLDETSQLIAKRHLQMDPRVNFLTLDGKQYVLDNQHQRYDFIFADSWPGKFYVLEETLRLLNPGGIYIIDDLIPVNTWSPEHKENVRELIAKLKNNPEITSTELNWSTGILIAVKIAF